MIRSTRFFVVPGLLATVSTALAHGTESHESEAERFEQQPSSSSEESAVAGWSGAGASAPTDAS